MIARLQQFATLSILLGSPACVALFAWHGFPIVGIFVALAVAFGYALVIAAELIMLTAVIHRSSRPPMLSLLRAWWNEVKVAPRVFNWRQPFKSTTWRDQLPARPDGRRAVLLVHGFLCNRGFWNPWMQRLASAGIPFMAINLEPAFGSISMLTPQIGAAVRCLQAATGVRPLIVAHSMGGLAVRSWYNEHTTDCLVERIITIGTPHQGTWLARFGSTTNVRQMSVNNDWILSLAASSSVTKNAVFTCFYSDCDNAVFPSENATLEGADNRLVSGAGHIDLAFRNEVFGEVLVKARAPGVS